MDMALGQIGRTRALASDERTGLQPADVLRPLATAVGLLLAWWVAVLVFRPAPWLLPSPVAVLGTIADSWRYLVHHASITALEIVLGLGLGTALGVATALLVEAWRPAQRWLMPLVLGSQALPVFAVAPLLMVWFGLGLGSKVAMATLIIYFPIASSLIDGLQHVPRDWVDLARTMGLSKRALLWRVRLPAAMPSLASGLRVAATVAPIGAVVGEWVGAAGGLGFVMTQANARLQTDMTFAALLALVLLVLVLRAFVVAALDRIVFWSPKTDGTP